MNLSREIVPLSEPYGGVGWFGSLFFYLTAAGGTEGLSLMCSFRGKVCLKASWTQPLNRFLLTHAQNIHEALLKGLCVESLCKVLLKGAIMYPTLQMKIKCCKSHVFDPR